MLRNSRKKVSALLRRHAAASALLSVCLMVALLCGFTNADALDSEHASAQAQDLSDRIVFLGDTPYSPDSFVFADGTRLTLSQRGIRYTVFTEEESIPALLLRLNISVEDDQLISMEFDGEEPTLSVVSDLICQVVEREPTVFETEYVADKSLAWGSEEVVQEGADGSIPSTYENRYEGGQLVSSTLLRVGEDSAVNRVIHYGTKSKNATVKVLDYDGGTIEADGESLSYTKCLRMTGTAYTAGVGEVDTVTATGTTVRVGCVAVDKRVIPLGSKLYIEGAKGSYVYGVAVAEDTGVRGNVIDLYMNSYQQCINFGRRPVNVYILG